MKKIGIFLILLGALLVGLRYGYWPYLNRPKVQQSTQQSVQNSTATSVVIGTHNLNVEVVSTPEKITRGLSGRDAIGSHGMLFVLPTRSTPSFWMKEMKISLDFIWIDGTSVVDLTEEVPPPYADVSDEQLPVYQPKVPVTHVLEVPAGSISQWQLKIGDPVVIR